MYICWYYILEQHYRDELAELPSAKKQKQEGKKVV